jgi:hypothetical protein
MTTKVRPVIDIEKIRPLLEELTVNTEEDIQRFLKEPRKEWMGLTPTQLIECGKGDVVVRFLNKMIHGDLIS